MWTKCNGSSTKFERSEHSVMDVQRTKNKVSLFVNKVWISTNCKQGLNQTQTEFKQSTKLSLHFVGTKQAKEHPIIVDDVTPNEF